MLRQVTLIRISAVLYLPNGGEDGVKGPEKTGFH